LVGQGAKPNSPNQAELRKHNPEPQKADFQAHALRGDSGQKDDQQAQAGAGQGQAGRLEARRFKLQQQDARQAEHEQHFRGVQTRAGVRGRAPRQAARNRAAPPQAEHHGQRN
jgi:hypothetical protein